MKRLKPTVVRDKLGAAAPQSVRYRAVNPLLQ